MAIRHGIQLDEYGEIILPMQVGVTDQQNQYLLLICHKGEFKESPTMGVGIENMIGDDDAAYWRKTITDEMARDGYNAEEIAWSNDTVNMTIT